jgi:membrane-bound lytic murein transglycosylase B
MGLLSVGAAMGGSYLLSMLADKVFGTGTSSAATSMSTATPELIAAITRSESGAQGQAAISSKGAIGLMQLMPDTAASLGVDPNDPAQNVAGGTAYINQLLRKYGGNVPEAVGAYNAGPERMDRFLAGKATLPSETQNYISSVLSRAGQTGSVTVGNIVINITKPHPSNDEVAGVVQRRIQDLQGKAVQRNLAQQQDYAYDY